MRLTRLMWTVYFAYQLQGQAAYPFRPPAVIQRDRDRRARAIVAYAYRHVRPPGVSCPAVVSAGGETFMAYALDGRGRIVNVMTGNKCASGTGEFLLQQLRRMDVTLEEAFRWAATEDPHPVSGRCSSCGGEPGPA